MNVLDVFELTAYVKDLVEGDPILADLWVRGEVTNLSRSSAGHMYFNLAGDGALLSCVLFRGNQRGLLALPRPGESILAHGRISVYESRGQYQLIVDNVAPEGIGILQLQFEELRRRLEAEGLFNPARKRRLPPFPARIGVVTSPTGSVWHDIQTVIARRFPLVELVLAPSVVQGPDAPAALIAALQALNEDDTIDVILLARGGGSAEDLACFNDERLARAIFASRVPVVSAVGHETDVTIADLVADVRAPTPSAAAEVCVPNAIDLAEQIEGMRGVARQATSRRIGECRDPLLRLQSRVARLNPQQRVDRYRQDIDALTWAASAATGRRIAALRERTNALRQAGQHLDPRGVLRRGYAIVTSSNGTAKRIASAEAARRVSPLAITFADGTIHVELAKERV